MEQVKINSLELENVKRIKAVKLTVTENGLTVIGGDNNQGKTSVLDSIAWLLGGDRFRPSEPNRVGSTIPAHLKIQLSNGLTVERYGKNGSLKIIDENGNKCGQQLLNEFIEVFALNLSKFLDSSGKEKANILLKIIGVGDKLSELEREEKQLYDKRHGIGVIAEQKAKYASELAHYPEVGTELISISELIQKQQAILAKNGENQRKRAKREQYDRELALAQIEFDRAKKALEEAQQNALAARKSAEALHDESTAELEENIQQIEVINNKIRSNIAKENALDEAAAYKKQYDNLSLEIDGVRREKHSLLEDADLPLPELIVSEGELIYKGQKWDNMSSSEQLKVATAIVRRLKPQCGFVLIDKLEQMDVNTLKEFCTWLESEGLQAIGTRVSQGDECSIIIEDGYVKGEESPFTLAKEWKSGEF